MVIDAWAALLGGTLVCRFISQSRKTGCRGQACSMGRPDVSCMGQSPGFCMRCNSACLRAVGKRKALTSGGGGLTRRGSNGSCGSLPRSASVEDFPRRGQAPVEREPVGSFRLPPPALSRNVEDQTLLGVFADKGYESQIRLEDGTLNDVSMEPFLEAAVAYREAMATLGVATGMVLGDFEKNYTAVRLCVDADPDKRATLRSFLEVELQSGQHRAGSGSACKLADPSGACQLSWLLRGFEFFLTMLKFIFEGESNAVIKAYDQTLAQYHGWGAAMVTKAALVAMPGKESICRIQALCARASDERRLSTAISRDAARAARVMLPTVQFMISNFREMRLWESTTV